MEKTAKARQDLTDLFNPSSQSPTTLPKILLLGIRDTYDYHRDLIVEGEPVSKSERVLRYYREAIRFWGLHDKERAVYYLGGALYHLQDAWLGVSDDPSYEDYLEKTLDWSKQKGQTESASLPEKDLEGVVREAETERQRLDGEI